MKNKPPDYLQLLSQDKDYYHSFVLEVFAHQYKHVPVYNTFANALGKTPDKVRRWQDIPFMPVEFFKQHKVIAPQLRHQHIFKSSGTSSWGRAQHYVHSLLLYERSFLQAFQLFYGKSQDYAILALLPSYIENGDSSLVYMVEGLIKLAKNPNSGFYLHNHSQLANKLTELQKKQQKTLLIGVSYALLDFVEAFPMNFPELIVMETGGMKGRRQELLRQELHQKLQAGFGVANIHSEYGMSELLSQAYSQGKGRFNCPPWMQIHIRDTKDPFQYMPKGKSGAINIIDLANFYAVSFLATQDIGTLFADGSFEVLGRFDHSDVRGCNLLIP